MATNAPYYQMRGQFTNAANAQFVPDDVDDYDLSTSVTPHDATLYSEHQPSENPIPSLEENHNFVELLEAATTAAAGQAAQAMNTESAGSSAVMPSKGKRKRASSPPADGSGDPAGGHAPGYTASSSKRARIDVPTDPQLHGNERHERDGSESSSVPPSNESLLNDARAAGVHSAAALFRRSSERSSRKYTRPPMSKLFMSLQLTPENFLHLQAQAKAYMLDPAHPDRQSCVGNRGKGDTDMVKLRLFNCVRDFLSDGVGEQFFGEHVEKPGDKDVFEAAQALGEEKAPAENKLIWPRDGNKIISLVTPLLRRMVTNERQRMYAIESRKGGTKKKEPSVEATPSHDDHQGQHTEQAQPAFNLANLPLAPAQNQSQHSHTASTIPSLPLHSSDSLQAAYQAFAMAPPHYTESPRSSIELSPGRTLLLPLEGPAEPLIDHLNIFLVKNNVKLETTKRYDDTPQARLYYMSWEDLLARIHQLLKEAMLLYPQLQEEIDNQGMGPEALRGLAVAATEIQNDLNPQNANDKSTARSDSLTNTSPTSARASTNSASSDASTKPLLSNSRTIPFDAPSGSSVPASLQTPSSNLPSAIPAYKISSMWSKGWLDINGGEDWHHIKLDIAFAHWADRVLNLVVELL